MPVSAQAQAAGCPLRAAHLVGLVLPAAAVPRTNQTTLMTTQWPMRDRPSWTDRLLGQQVVAHQLKELGWHASRSLAGPLSTRYPYQPGRKSHASGCRASLNDAKAPAR